MAYCKQKVEWRNADKIRRKPYETGIWKYNPSQLELAFRIIKQRGDLTERNFTIYQK